MHNLVVDCGTGETRTVPLPADEVARLAAHAAETAATQEATAAQRARLFAAVQAKAGQDPAYAALAQLAGVLPMSG